MSAQILIIDEMHFSIHDLLRHAGLEPVYCPKIIRKEIIDLSDQFIGMIVRHKTVINEELLQNQHRLKFVARAGAGLDQLDVDYLDSQNISVINAPEGNRDALGEHVLGMLLNISNNLRKADLEVRNGIWDREGNRGFEIKNKVVGLLGYGFMGSSVAEKLAGFGCEVIAYDKYKSDYSDHFVRETNMDEIYERSDIFSLHVPLTGETENLVNKEYLEQFEKDIVLINTARGKIVPLGDLVKVLDAGKIKFAALDVLENEHIDQLSAEKNSAFNELTQRNNVLFSPHVGGWTVESYENFSRVLVEKIEKLDW